MMMATLASQSRMISLPFLKIREDDLAPVFVFDGLDRDDLPPPARLPHRRHLRRVHRRCFLISFRPRETYTYLLLKCAEQGRGCVVEYKSEEDAKNIARGIAPRD
jgi:hypothetical protein